MKLWNILFLKCCVLHSTCFFIIMKYLKVSGRMIRAVQCRVSGKQVKRIGDECLCWESHLIV